MSNPRPPRRAAFTLIEILVSMAVLALIVVLAAQMSSATLSTVSHSTHTLDSIENVRTATMILRDELGGMIVSKREDRFLNLRVNEDDAGVALFFTVPRAHAGNLSRMGFVAHVAFVWDRETRTLGRAEYHSSREPEAVRSTAVDADCADAAANLARLRKLTPAYAGNGPFAWTELPIWEARLKEARRNPVLTGVAEWKIECFETPDLDDDKATENIWWHDDRLPAAMRLTFVINPQPGTLAKRTPEERKEHPTAGRRYLSIIPLPGAEAR